ncbi:uroporphyrinogen-III synthase, partial [Brevundimonas sp.]|uniref:uroporphyrinogen-III synthase n=1 Tax=Brevundimonas sp. TaxID=1871086 RepID=UPI0035B1527D
MIRSPSARVWITRAELGAARTADRLREQGFEPLIRPLLAVEFLPADLPDIDGFAALAFTSRNGVAAFAALSSRRDRPVFAVGDATARAAREIGFTEVQSADGDLIALARLVASRASGPILAPVAETPAGDLGQAVRAAGGAASIQSVAVYRTASTDAPPPDAFDAVLVHSPRAAQVLAQAGRTPALARAAVV